MLLWAVPPARALFPTRPTPWGQGLAQRSWLSLLNQEGMRFTSVLALIFLKISQCWTSGLAPDF